MDHKTGLELLEENMQMESATSTEDSRKVVAKSELPVVSRRSLQGCRELPPLPPGLDIQTKRFQLELEMSNSQKAALNNGTANNYLNYLNSYTSFCDEYGYQPFPLNEIILSMFAQYLSRKLKPQSIKCAVSSLRTISNIVGYKTTENQFLMVKLTLWGIGNLKPAPPQKSSPNDSSYSHEYL